MNKKGKFNAEKSGKMLLIIMSIVVLGGIIFMGATGKLVSQSTYGDDLSPTVPNAGTCALAPSVTTAFADTLNQGTAITPTLTYQVRSADGILVTTSTAPTYRANVNILANASGYITTVVPSVALDCGANLVAGKMYANATPVLTYKSDDGTKILSVSQNESVKSAGSAYNWELKFTGTDKKSTGKMLVIVELSSLSNVSSASMSGATAVPIPNGYARQISNGYVGAFLIDPVVGAVPVVHNLNVQSATSMVVTGTVYTTVYNVEPFVETDGSISDNGLAFNSLNTAKYHSVTTKNFIIA